MNSDTPSSKVCKADKNLEKLFHYYTQPDCRIGRKRQRTMRKWLKVRERNELKLWKVFEDTVVEKAIVKMKPYIKETTERFIAAGWVAPWWCGTKEEA